MLGTTCSDPTLWILFGAAHLFQLGLVWCVSFFFPLIGNCRYGADLARQLTTNLLSVLDSCGSIRICFSNRTPEKVLLRMYIFLLWFVLCSGTNCFPFARLQVSNVISKELGGNPKVYIWDGQGIMWNLIIWLSGQVLSLIRIGVLVLYWWMFWSPEPNPHLGHLAWADAFVVTADSVSMISEVCSTGYDWGNFICIDDIFFNVFFI